MSDLTDEEVEEEAKRIVRESMEMDDYGPITSIEGECDWCKDDAVFRDPEMDKQFCETHAKDWFSERHG